TIWRPARCLCLGWAGRWAMALAPRGLLKTGERIGRSIRRGFCFGRVLDLGFAERLKPGPPNVTVGFCRAWGVRGISGAGLPRPRAIGFDQENAGKLHRVLLRHAHHVAAKDCRDGSHHGVRIETLGHAAALDIKKLVQLLLRITDEAVRGLHLLTE